MSFDRPRTKGESVTGMRATLSPVVASTLSLSQGERERVRLAGLSPLRRGGTRSFPSRFRLELLPQPGDEGLLLLEKLLGDAVAEGGQVVGVVLGDRKSTRLNSSH